MGGPEVEPNPSRQRSPSGRRSGSSYEPAGSRPGSLLSCTSEVGRDRSAATRCFAVGGVSRDAAIRRIDDQRRPLLPVDDGVTGTRVQPEGVIAAHVPCRTHRSVAALGRSGPIAFNGHVALLLQRRRPGFSSFGRLFGRQGRLGSSRPFNRRQRGQVVGALKIGMAVRHACLLPQRDRHRRGERQRKRIESASHHLLDIT